MKATGKQLITGSLTVDSPLGFGEQWSVSANTDMDGSASHPNRYIVANLNIPYGYFIGFTAINFTVTARYNCLIYRDSSSVQNYKAI